MSTEKIGNEKEELLQKLPAIEKLLTQPEIIKLVESYSRSLVTDILRSIVSDFRSQILEGNTEINIPHRDEFPELVIQHLKDKLKPPIRTVINATGTVTHTNLGRSLLPESVCNSITKAAQNYVNLEYDLETGTRGHRDRLTEPLLQELTSCEASTIVNNNAAAVLISLNTLARGKEVIVSRGELIEIGGAFRIPDVMTSSGAILREVGTTNRTHLRDYEEAINENTSLFLKVHPSNYKILGFTSTPDIQELALLGKEHNIPLMEDLGSGALVDLSNYGLPYEPVVADRMQAGVDIVTFSGDKLLGGPQAGIIAGKTEMIQRIRKNPLMRALRVDKLTIAALSTTLQNYLSLDNEITDDFPMLQRYIRPVEELYASAETVSERLQSVFQDSISIEASETKSQIGSGSLPEETLNSVAVGLSPKLISVEKLSELFRQASTPVIGRIEDNKLFFDIRTLYDVEIECLIQAAHEISSRIEGLHKN